MERKILINWYNYVESHTDVDWKGPVKITWSNPHSREGKLK